MYPEFCDSFWSNLEITFNLRDVCLLFTVFLDLSFYRTLPALFALSLTTVFEAHLEFGLITVIVMDLVPLYIFLFLHLDPLAKNHYRGV